MPAVRPFYQDPFKPVLFNSPPVVVSQEQLQYIQRILEKACSDSRFAEKALASILIVLTQGNTPLPIVESLNPTTAKLGTPNFTLHVLGQGFVEGSRIVWNGGEEDTVRVSQSELTTGVNMDTAEVAMPISVQVRTPDGVLSNAMTFILAPADELVGTSASREPEQMKLPFDQKVVKK